MRYLKACYAVNGRADATITQNTCDLANAAARIGLAAFSSRYPEKVVPVSSYPLKLPDSLKHEAQLRAKRDGVSLNQWIATAVAEKVGSMKAVDLLNERATCCNPNGKRLLGILRDAPDRAPDAGDELPN